MLSVIVVTYNDPARLQLALHGFLRQTAREFELIVVNDGGDRTINLPLYEEMRRRGRGVPEIWLGPETPAFRLAAARNAGLKRARGERVLFFDGDCIPAPDVVALHAAYRNRNVFVSGARKHIAESTVAKLQPADLDDLERHVIGEDARYRMQGPHYTSLRDRLATGAKNISLPNFYQAWAFNCSVPTRLARKIGGFNEAFVGWGGEGQEFAARMEMAGTALVGRFDIICYHLDHPKRLGSGWVRLLKESLSQPTLVRNDGPLPGPRTRTTRRSPRTR